MPLSSVLGAQSLVRTGVCTSTSRPASPFDGQVIYETDTNLCLVYEDNAWAVLNSGELGNRNLVINGAMQIHQRGTSAAAISAQYNTADRFAIQKTNAGTWTQDIQSDGPTGSGFRKSLRFLCTTAATSPAAGDLLMCEQILEGQNVQVFAKGTASAKQYTLSFWVKSNVTGTFVVRLVDADNTRHVASTYTVSTSDAWERKTITFPADTTGVFDNDNAASLRIQWWLVAGSTNSSGTLQTTWAADSAANRAVGQTNTAATLNNYWQITGTQLEVGPIATPFEFEDYSVTLAKCQRYYFRINHNGNGRVLPGYAFSTTVALAIASFPTEMRTSPSALEQSGTASHYNIWYTNTRGTCNAVPTFNSCTTTGAVMQFTVASGLTAGHGTACGFETTAGFLGWSAEL